MQTSLPSLPAAGQPLRLVLDTNVVMALWHFRDPRLLQLRAFIDAGQAVLLTRAECLDELQRVLQYVQFKLDAATQATMLADYARLAHRVADASAAETEAARALPQCKDRDDQKFLQLAWDGGAHALITRDKLLLGLARRAPLRERLAILTPERFAQIHLVAAAGAVQLAIDADSS